MFFGFNDKKFDYIQSEEIEQDLNKIVKSIENTYD